MKHIVSWTLSDVPQEARELARASALREGISVGDWLARRILVEGQQDKAAPATNGNSFHSDSDHLDRRPYSTDSDTIRFACVEAETHSAILPIHETMRGLADRFETIHRSDEHEISRVCSPGPDATTREQDSAFQHLSERMDRVERHTDTKGLRDAIRGLHQGLSRVAEQVAGISNECSGQFTTLARSIEVLAKDVASPRGESKQTIQALEARVAELQERLEQDKHQIEGALHLEDRLKRAEERIASSSTSEECLARLELRIKAAEERIPEALAGPIAAIQGNFDGMNARLRRAEEREELDAQAQKMLLALSARLDAAEQKNGAIQAELNASIDKTVKSIEAIENNQILGVPLGPVPAFSDPSPVQTGGHAAEGNQTHYGADGSLQRHMNPSPPSTSDFVAQGRRAAQSAANTAAEHDRTTKQQVRTPRRKVSKTASALIAVAVLIVMALAIGVSTKRNSARTAELTTPNLPNHTVSLQPANTIKARTGLPSSPSAAPPVQPPLALANAAPNTITASPVPPPTQIPKGPGKPSATHGAGSEASTTDTDDGRLLEAQAKAGNAVAQYRLGARYENGRSVIANAPAAVHWYSEAAKRGNRKAMHNLGTAYASGKGTQKDLAAAARWFKAAAELGVTDSQFNLAMLYEHGLGVPFSIAEAYKWYAIAAEDGGDPESKSRVAALSSRIPSAEREAANRTAKIFKPQPMNLAANEDSR